MAALCLFGLWLILNAKITLEIVLVGLFITLAIYAFMCFFMDYSPKKDIMLFRIIFHLIAYFAVLLWEILKANITLMKIILRHSKEIQPIIVEIDVPLQSKLTQVLFANSVTLTPGTITVSAEGGHYTVHCLDKSMSEGIDTGIFAKRLMKMEEIINGTRKRV